MHGFNQVAMIGLYGIFTMLNEDLETSMQNYLSFDNIKGI